MELSIGDLARILGKSERTIARWLQEGKGGLSRLENGMIEVSEQDLLHLRPQDTETLILEKLASIEERLARMEAGLETLSRAGPVKQVGRVPRSPRPAPLQPALLPDLAEGEPVEIPAGTYSMIDAAGLVGINRRSLVDLLVTPTNKHLVGLVTNERNGLTHYVQPKRRGEMERTLTHSQVQAVIAWRSRRG